MNVATTGVQVPDFNGNPVVVPLFKLIQWKAALRLEALGIQGSRGSVTEHCRKLFSTPPDYPAEHIRAFIIAVLDEVEDIARTVEAAGSQPVN